VEQVQEHLRFVPGAPDLHVIFGWLQVEQRIALQSRIGILAWAHYHPHCQVIDPDPAESLYLSTPYLELPGMNIQQTGGGVFHDFAHKLCLTAEDYIRRFWRLPSWFHPSAGRRPLSYHSLQNYRLERNGQTVLLHGAAPGQEFVLDCDEYPEAIPWLSQLLDSSNA
jgi:hypothetical protein